MKIFGLRTGDSLFAEFSQISVSGLCGGAVPNFANQARFIALTIPINRATSSKMPFRYGIPFPETVWSHPQMAFFTKTWGKGQNGECLSALSDQEIRRAHEFDDFIRFALRRVALRLGPFAAGPALPTSRSIERHWETRESHKVGIPAGIMRGQRESFTRH